MDSSTVLLISFIVDLKYHIEANLFQNVKNFQFKVNSCTQSTWKMKNFIVVMKFLVFDIKKPIFLVNLAQKYKIVSSG